MKNSLLKKLLLTGLLTFLNIENFKNCFASGNAVEEFLDSIYPWKGCGESKEVEEIILTKDKIKELKEMPEHERLDFLCSRNVLQPVEMQKQLRCRYVNRGDPFLQIAPFKEEELYLEPRILLFHDIISDAEIDLITALAKPEFAAAGFKNVESGMIEVDAKLRDTQTGWLHDMDHRFVHRLSTRIGDMTQLNMETAEQLQIAYYETGGHYRPHFDFALFDDSEMFKELGTGNRIATVLFYFNEVEEGGNTVFTEINLSIKPKKGAAAFWYNLKPDGERDYLTLHSACPVLSGVKWAANKWLHIFGQEFHRPCSWNNETIVLN
ncbi:prolyl 4-hydroxylase subunit alpha-1-like [Leptopilina heterotoma]|uniref:prolyl 4-hydroxylase subunit alpha-1-like n=1 Tax=Leptopilina heterotoma TaxID=63436 RepID=UPI001CA8176B|nr:prolyl 4-hydroxylase subunit alpha-1-like [Leptopilina heterotoma]